MASSARKRKRLAPLPEHEEVLPEDVTRQAYVGFRETPHSRFQFKKRNYRHEGAVATYFGMFRTTPWAKRLRTQDKSGYLWDHDLFVDDRTTEDLTAGEAWTVAANWLDADDYELEPPEEQTQSTARIAPRVPCFSWLDVLRAYRVLARRPLDDVCKSDLLAVDSIAVQFMRCFRCSRQTAQRLAKWAATRTWATAPVGRYGAAQSALATVPVVPSCLDLLIWVTMLPEVYSKENGRYQDALETGSRPVGFFEEHQALASYLVNFPKIPLLPRIFFAPSNSRRTQSFMLTLSHLLGIAAIPPAALRLTNRSFLPWMLRLPVKMAPHNRGEQIGLKAFTLFQQERQISMYDRSATTYPDDPVALEVYSAWLQNAHPPAVGKVYATSRADLWMSAMAAGCQTTPLGQRLLIQLGPPFSATLLP